ncbi:MAG: hypothetical protein JO232_23945 [Verrucomicrobia bacterium]|jgi:transketolase N-terminal domain/subunit|nr:hypothetical protein [Verrucomicrobiota bacterium]
MSVEYSDLERLAQRGRWLVISTVGQSGAGHVGGPLSAPRVADRVIDYLRPAKQ